MTGFMAEGLTASILAGLVTGAGGFLTFFKAVYSKDDINLMLNTAAGVRLAAAFFSLMDAALTGLTQLLPGSATPRSTLAARVLPVFRLPPDAAAAGFVFLCAALYKVRQSLYNK